MAEEWLSIVEYARKFSISDMTVRRRIKNGKLNAVLKDGKYFIPIQRHADQPTISGAALDPSHRYQQSSKLRVRSASAQAKVHHRPGYQDETSDAPYDTDDQQAGYNISEAIKGQESTIVNGNSLLAFCEKTLSEVKQGRGHIEKKYEAIIKSLESRNHLLQSEVNKYKQQVEDLQLLVKVFEHNGASSKLSPP